jgi:hypothetical protein
VDWLDMFEGLGCCWFEGGMLRTGSLVGRTQSRIVIRWEGKGWDYEKRQRQTDRGTVV